MSRERGMEGGKSAGDRAGPDGSLGVRLRSSLREFELDVRFSAPPGGRIALIGPSGAGKSTILRMVAGLARPVHGRVSVGERPLFDGEIGIDLAPERRRVGYVPQDPTLFPHLDAADNVAYPIRGGRSPAKRSRALELLDAFGLAEMAKVLPGEMSGGEAKRVSLARAIAAEPEVFLLDEPLASLDATTHRKVLPALKEMLDRSGAPALVVTHSALEADRLAGESIRLEKGRLVGRPDEPDEEKRWNRSSGSGTSRRGRVSIRRTMRK